MQNAHKSRGIGVLVTHLLQEMGRQLPDDDVTLITQQRGMSPQLFAREHRINTFRLERPNRFNWMADHLFLSGLTRRSRAGVFLATDLNSYLLPSSGIKVASIVYDLIPLLFPEVMNSQPQPVRIGWKTNFRKLCHSDLIIAISRATRADLVRLMGVRPERIKVVYPGIDHALFNVANANDRARREELLNDYGVSGRYFLYVGDSEWRKNLYRCLEALQGVDPEIKLLLVGKRAATDAKLHGWIAELGLSGRVVTPGFVPDEDLPPLYGGAEAFLFPSLYEGFGLPVAEAMACGCPVITSSISSMPEVAGSAGILVDPCSVGEIRGAMKLILEDDALSLRMSKEGVEQAAQFSWERSAKETIELLRELA